MRSPPSASHFSHTNLGVLLKRYHDNHQRNVYFLNTLKKAMPIDWGPKGLQPGVEAVSGAERIRGFVQDLKQSLKDPYSIRALEEELLRHGEDLRE